MKTLKSNVFLIIFLISFIVAAPFVVRAVYGGTEAEIDPTEEQENAADPETGKLPETAPEDGEGETADDSASDDITPDEPPADTDGAGEITADTPPAGSEKPPETTEDPGEPDEPPGQDDSGEKAPSAPDTLPEAGDPSYFDDALFIGDSRTVGLSEYGNLQNADFFADTGMSVYNIYKATVSVPSVGKVKLTELLESKEYGKIYIMLGINELGYDFEATVKKYGELVEEVRSLQPEAILYIEANLHVTASRSDTDPVYNNPAIDRFNEAISELADGESIFYLDVNELFDDESGSLGTEYTSDNAHVLGKYYVVWCDWIRERVVTG
ncbi:MAG: GDSL-type esterase/lipase family protein [Oscillospiraceae bacterium]